MRRLKEGNPNTPEAFDVVWRDEMAAGRRQFDLYRFRAMMHGIPRGAAVIELGCGCSEFLTYMLNHHPGRTATGLDYSCWAVEYMQQIDPRVGWVQGDALNAPYADASFDVVLAGELIEHLDDPEALLREMRRLTKPRGFLRVTTPIEAIVEQDRYHVWSLAPDDLVKMLAGFGLRARCLTVGNYYVATGEKA